MIRVGGYSIKRKGFVELREATIYCEYNEIDKMISFLQFIKDNHASDNWQDDYRHTHLRDWDKNWMEGETDIIVISSKPASDAD